MTVKTIRTYPNGGGSPQSFGLFVRIVPPKKEEKKLVKKIYLHSTKSSTI